MDVLNAKDLTLNEVENYFGYREVDEFARYSDQYAERYYADLSAIFSAALTRP